jgi:GNAT superfamily N-acetyltransferase
MGHHSDIPRVPRSVPEILTRTPEENDRLGIASPGLSDLVHKFRRNAEDYGWNIALRKTFAYLVRAVYFQQVYRIYGINLDSTKPPEHFDKHNFTYKILTPQNVDMIAQVENIAEWLRGHVKKRIETGQLCLVALDGEKVAGFNLINLEQAVLILVNLKKDLRPGCAWSSHIAVKREYRRAGLGSQLRYRIFYELKKRGFRRLYGGTLRSNTASLKLTRSVGFKEIADVHYHKFLSFENWRYERVRA